ncbi:MAG: helix-hairpin-helix domain-containing protein [Microcoleus sp.]
MRFEFQFEASRRSLCPTLRRPDESHRFAVSYHSVLKTKHQTNSLLDEIPGVGPLTRKKLLRSFGSVRGVQGADEDALVKIVGPKLGRLILKWLRQDQTKL